MIIITIGLPGAGKSSVARNLKQTYNFDIVATGEILRKEIFKKSSLGQEIQDSVEHGELINDQLVIDFVKDRITSSRDVILQGFPRNLKQAEALDEILTDNGKSIDLVLYFDSDAEQDIQRLASRRTCPTCHAVFNNKTFAPRVEGICDHCESELIWREDDKPQNLIHKIDLYRQHTKPLKDYYKNMGILTVIDARQSQIDVYYDVLASSKKFTERTF